MRSIRDNQLKPIATRIDASVGKAVTDQNVLEILAAIGDKAGRSAAQALTALQAPGLSRSEQFAIASPGQSKSERKDIEQLLDQSGFSFSKGAKNFLEALVGRAALDVGAVPVGNIVADGAGIRGQIDAGATIEAINLSAAPMLRLHLVDTKTIGTAEGQGRFALDANRITGTDAMSRWSAGDVIRVRSRRTDGTTTDWIDLKIGGRDATNAQFNPLRMTVTDEGNGKVALNHNSSRPITEPNALLRFTNIRTGDQVDARADANGSVAKGLLIAGKAGDAIAVSVSDGTNNTNFTTVSSTIMAMGNSHDVDATDDPKMHKDELRADGTPMYPLKRYTGPLFIDGPKSSDVRQGAIGDCYLPSGVAAVAHQMPSVIEDAITEQVNAQGEREFTVRLYSQSGRMNMVTVDADFYTRSWGGPIYGTTTGNNDADKMELWFPILEKAFAKWKGSYDAIGNGGSAAMVMTALTGKMTTSMSTGYDSADDMFAAIKRGGEQGRPMAAGTHDDKTRYANTGVYADHSYSVLGTEESGGKKFVLLRNPWGESEAGSDGKNDGYFKLDIAQFMKLYDNVDILRS
jgi:hypothetical protein